MNLVACGEHYRQSNRLSMSQHDLADYLEDIATAFNRQYDQYGGQDQQVDNQIHGRH
jgi:hypothetical protein